MKDAVAHGDCWFDIIIVQQHGFRTCFAGVDKQPPMNSVMFTTQFGQ